MEEIETALKSAKQNASVINELSGKFYTIIPHDFGRTRPTPISDIESLRKKYDMLMVKFHFYGKHIDFEFKNNFFWCNLIKNFYKEDYIIHQSSK